MATRTPQLVTSSGLQPTYHPASAGGDKVPPGSLLHVKNANAASRTLTLVTVAVFDADLAVADRVDTIPAVGSGGSIFIRVPDAGYRGADNLVSLTWSTDVDVTFAVLS